MLNALLERNVLSPRAPTDSSPEKANFPGCAFDAGSAFQTVLKRAFHPGEILKDELAEVGASPTAFARKFDMPLNRVSQTIGSKPFVTDDVAPRFGLWFGTEPQIWLTLQGQIDLFANSSISTIQIVTERYQ